MNHQVQNLGVKLIKLNPNATVPSYGTEFSAGADVYTCIEKDITIKAGEVALVPTGISIEIPTGYEVQIRPRSGLALKNSIFVLNSPGTIDSDYRGEIKVILANFGKNDFVVQNNIRIAQMVLCSYFKCSFTEVEQTSQTTRSSGGFGSTGN